MLMKAPVETTTFLTMNLQEASGSHKESPSISTDSCTSSKPSLLQTSFSSSISTMSPLDLSETDNGKSNAHGGRDTPSGSSANATSQPTRRRGKLTGFRPSKSPKPKKASSHSFKQWSSSLPPILTSPSSREANNRNDRWQTPSEMPPHAPSLSSPSQPQRKRSDAVPPEEVLPKPLPEAPIIVSRIPPPPPPTTPPAVHIHRTNAIYFKHHSNPQHFNGPTRPLSTPRNGQQKRLEERNEEKDQDKNDREHEQMQTEPKTTALSLQSIELEKPLGSTPKDYRHTLHEDGEGHERKTEGDNANNEGTRQKNKHTILPILQSDKVDTETPLSPARQKALQRQRQHHYQLQKASDAAQLANQSRAQNITQLSKPSSKNAVDHEKNQHRYTARRRQQQRISVRQRRSQVKASVRIQVCIRRWLAQRVAHKKRLERDYLDHVSSERQKTQSQRDQLGAMKQRLRTIELETADDIRILRQHTEAQKDALGNAMRTIVKSNMQRGVINLKKGSDKVMEQLMLVEQEEQELKQTKAGLEHMIRRIRQNQDQMINSNHQLEQKHQSLAAYTSCKERNAIELKANRLMIEKVMIPNCQRDLCSIKNKTKVESAVKTLFREGLYRQVVSVKDAEVQDLMLYLDVMDMVRGCEEDLGAEVLELTDGWERDCLREGQYDTESDDECFLLY